MASSPAEPGDLGPAAGAVVFALRELTACWDQAYEALCRGDLEQVAALLDVAQDHVAAAGTGGASDGDAEVRLRSDAASARGRLEHGMRAGMDALAQELGRTRAGGKALRGYANAPASIGDRVARDA